MILEGLVTTINADGTGHVAAMGPHVPGPDFARFTLKPFRTSQTFRNLEQHGEGVLHVTDDVLLMARAALGDVRTLPPYFDAITVQGFVLSEACRFFEFRVRSIDSSNDRAVMVCEVYYSGKLRDFFGFNRARHAVLEATIAATRFHLLPAAEIDAEFARAATLVEKCGGQPERDALAFLIEQRRLFREGGNAPVSPGRGQFNEV